MRGLRSHLRVGIASAAIGAGVVSAAGWRAGILLLPIVAVLLVPFASSSPKGHLGFAAVLGIAVGGWARCALVGLGALRAMNVVAILAAFGMFLAATSSLARARGWSHGAASLAGAVPGLILLGSIWWADPLVVATQGHPSIQGGLIQVATAGNPLLALAHHVLGQDLLHTTSLYGRSEIADRFYAQPPLWQIVLVFVAVAAVLDALARVARRAEV